MFRANKTIFRTINLVIKVFGQCIDNERHIAKAYSGKVDIDSYANNKCTFFVQRY